MPETCARYTQGHLNMQILAGGGAYLLNMTLQGAGPGISFPVTMPADPRNQHVGTPNVAKQVLDGEPGSKPGSPPEPYGLPSPPWAPASSSVEGEDEAGGRRLPSSADSLRV